MTPEKLKELRELYSWYRTNELGTIWDAIPELLDAAECWQRYAEHDECGWKTEVDHWKAAALESAELLRNRPCETQGINPGCETCPPCRARKLLEDHNAKS